MKKLINNKLNQGATCPAFFNVDEVLRYVKSKRLDGHAMKIQVPVTVADTRHCFWVQPEISPYPSVRNFLVNPRQTPTGIAGPEKQEGQFEILCYAIKGRLWVGVKDQQESGDYLKSLTEGLHHPLALAEAQFIGRVEAGC